jgi:hypothetical protein
MNTDALTRMEDWLGKAHRAVITRYPTVYFGTETEEKYAAGEKLDAALYAHFYEGSISLEELLVVWRVYYRSAIPF